MIVLFVLLLVLTISWAAMQWTAARGLSHALQPKALSTDDPYPSVSVIIPARNESENIEDCLQSVLSNNYPSERLEIIVVDDASDDDTARTAAQCLTDSPYTGRVISIPRTSFGGSKHRALFRGIHRAEGDIILTTDADCLVTPGWVYSMVSCFGDETQLVAGPVKFDSLSTLFDKLQAVEFLGLIAFGAGTIGCGRGTICNSANLAYRKSTYLGLDIESDSPAADELMLQHLSRENPTSIRFCPHPGGIVRTLPESSLQAFWHQRVRWASMGTQYPDWTARSMALSAWLFHVLLIICTVIGIAGVAALWPAILAWLGKVGSDARLIFPLLKRVDEERLIAYFFPAELLHPFYIAAIGIGGTFGRFSWKD